MTCSVCVPGLTLTRNLLFGKLAAAGLFGATHTPPRASSSLSLPLYSPRPGWGPIVCARLAQLWGPSAHFPRDEGPTCRAGEHTESTGPVLQLPEPHWHCTCGASLRSGGCRARAHQRRWGGLVQGRLCAHRCLAPVARTGVWEVGSCMGEEFTGPISSSCGFQSVNTGTGLPSSLTSYCRKKITQNKLSRRSIHGSFFWRFSCLLAQGLLQVYGVLLGAKPHPPAGQVNPGPVLAL